MIQTIFKKYKLQFSITLFLILSEAILTIFFPLFIGFAIDDAIHESYDGIVKLGTLALISLFLGVGRRIFDSRFYAKVYENMGVAIISNMKNTSESKKSARLNMIRELIEFLENSLPELVNSIIGLVGVVLIISSLNTKIFIGSLMVTTIIFCIYKYSSKNTLRYNQKTNDELENQVQQIASNNKKQLGKHLNEVMKWNIKLSDLEAINFSLSWLIVMTFLILSIRIAISEGIVKYGTLFALVIYVFQYIENTIQLPFFYQNWLRLKEILFRLEGKEYY